VTTTHLTPQEIADVFTTGFGDGIREISVREWAEGSKKTKNTFIWIRLDRNIFRDAVLRLVEIDYPHLGVISGSDTGDGIELLYHFLIYFGVSGAEIMVTLAVPLPKSDLRIPTISDIIPGAVYTEREKQEMLGIDVVGIPDNRGLFLPSDFPAGVYPWRKDDTGIRDDMIKNLWAVGRPTDRPAPYVPPKEEKEPAPRKAPATKDDGAGAEKTAPEGGTGQAALPEDEEAQTSQSEHETGDESAGKEVNTDE